MNGNVHHVCFVRSMQSLYCETCSKTLKAINAAEDIEENIRKYGTLLIDDGYIDRFSKESVNGCNGDLYHRQKMNLDDFGSFLF